MVTGNNETDGKRISEISTCIRPTETLMIFPSVNGIGTENPNLIRTLDRIGQILVEILRIGLDLD